MWVGGCVRVCIREESWDDFFRETAERERGRLKRYVYARSRSWGQGGRVRTAG